MSRALILTLLGGSIAVASHAETPTSFQGAWTLDISRSYVPNEAAPRSSVMQVSVDDGRNFAWSETTVGVDGKSGTVGFHGAFDGRAYPMSGADGTSLKFTRLSPTSYREDGTEPGGSHWTETCKIESDQKTLTCEGSQSDPKGGAVDYNEVWVRG